MTNKKALITTDNEALKQLKAKPGLYERYQTLDKKWNGRLKNFLTGKSSLPLTYDPFFKFIFNPDLHSDRLSHFISSLLGMTVQVVEVLSSEDTLMDGESYLIMDLVVQAVDGSIINVEIQKQGYGFPGERMSCYAADLLLRQYIKVKKTISDKKLFSYRDIKQVYVIVIFEKSTREFRTTDNDYLHHGEIIFDTGIKLNMLEKFYVISLDVFHSIPYSEIKKTEQAAWLFLLSTESMEDAERLIQDFPWLEPIYQEIASLRQHPEEVLSMWSDALSILDENSLKYRVEELDEELDQALKEKDAALARVAELEQLLAETKNNK